MATSCHAWSYRMGNMIMTAATDAPTPLSRSEVEDWDQRWLEAWNAHEVETLLSMCARDVFFDEPSLPTPARGREEVRSFLQATFEAYPDMRIDVLGPPVLIDGSTSVLSRYRVSATMTGAWVPGNLAPTRARMSFEGIDHWTFTDSGLSRCTTYYDTLGVARQLGIIPQVASRGERTLTRLQHLQAWFQRRGNPAT
jgi:steroid delta-isomerase-like uncharacterized protein